METIGLRRISRTENSIVIVITNENLLFYFPTSKNSDFSVLVCERTHANVIARRRVRRRALTSFYFAGTRGRPQPQRSRQPCAGRQDLPAGGRRHAARALFRRRDGSVFGQMAFGKDRRVS